MVISRKVLKVNHFFVQIAMTLYGNKNLEEMRTNSKIIIQRQNKEKSRESGKLQLIKTIGDVVFFFVLMILSCLII